MSFVYTRMSSVCHSYVFVCHLYVLVCHPYVTCTGMSSVCDSYVLVCHPYVPRMYSYVICMSLVCHSYVNRMWFWHEPKITLIHFHSLSFYVLLVDICCTTRLDSLSLVVTHCHSLSLVNIRCTTLCYSLSFIVPFVVTRCTIRLSFHKRSSELLHRSSNLCSLIHPILCFTEHLLYQTGKSSHWRCSIKKLFVKISQYSQENTYDDVSFK